MNKNDPVDPELAVPVENLNDPLSPATPALLVRTLIDPEEVAVPSSDTRETDPPVLLSPLPASRLTKPPIPAVALLATPELTAIAPPR